MPNSPISFTVRLTFSDLYRTQLWVLLKGSWAIWGMLALAVLLTVNTLRWNAQQEEVAINFVPIFWLLGLWIVLLLVLPAFQIRSRFKIQKSLYEETRYSISDDRIEMESATASFRYDWSHILRAVETKSYFYLFTSKLPTFIIPKRDISEVTQITTLREIVRNYVKGKVQLLS